MTKEELLKDEAFVKEVAKMKSVEEAQKAFAAKGVDISIDELNKLKEKAASGKLDMNELDAVAGGVYMEQRTVTNPIPKPTYTPFY